MTKYIHFRYGVTYQFFSYCIFAKLQQTTSDCNKILRQQCTIYCQANCQISVRSAKANNSYGGFCEVILKHISFRSLLSIKTWNWSVLEWPLKSHY